MSARRAERPQGILPPREPRKYAQGQAISRDGPPLGDIVASALIFRFSPRWTLEIIGVEDHDPRKSKKRIIKGVHSPFCFCLPGGRQQTDMKSQRKELPHFIARKESQEEAGVSLPLNELLPVLAVRRVGWGKAGRDQFDRERPNDGQVIHFDHFIFVCYGEEVAPGKPREENIKNPAWHPIEGILDNPLWSFDHVTLIVATLQVLGGLCERWSSGKWAPEKTRGTEEQALGAYFFERLKGPLTKSPEALAALIQYGNTDLLGFVTGRMQETRESSEDAALWYLGITKKQDMVLEKKLEGGISNLMSDIDQTKERIRVVEKVQGRSRMSAETEKELEKDRSVLADMERQLARHQFELRQKRQGHPGRFVADSFRSLGNCAAYEEVVQAIDEEKASRA